MSDGEQMEVPFLNRLRQHLRLDKLVLGQDCVPVGVKSGHRVRLGHGEVVPGARGNFLYVGNFEQSLPDNMTPLGIGKSVYKPNVMLTGDF